MILFRASFLCAPASEISLISAADTLAKDALALPACAGCSVYSDTFVSGGLVLLADWHARDGLDTWMGSASFRMFFRDTLGADGKKADIRIYEMSELQRM